MNKFFGFIVWRCRAKQMSEGIAIMYVIAFGYGSLLSLGYVVPMNISDWFLCLIVWPLTLYGVYQDIRSYLSQTSAKPA